MKLKNNKNLKLYIVFAAIFVAVLCFDLITKSLINSNMALHEYRGFIPYILGFRNEHNYGAAWSLFAGQQILLIVLTAIFLVIFIYYIYTLKNKNLLLMISAGFIIGGAVGNLIDRIFLGYVRDFLQFEFWSSFPIFNIADMFLVMGVILIVVFFIISFVKEAKHDNKVK